MDEMMRAIIKFPNGTGLIVEMKNRGLITGFIDTIYKDDNGLDFESEGYEEYDSCVIYVTKLSRDHNGEIYQPGQLTEINYKMPVEQIQLFDGTVIWKSSESKQFEKIKAEQAERCSLRLFSDAGRNGNAISSYEYDEFGNETASTGTFDNPYRYAGYEYLDEVELYDLNARYYDPSIARFLTEDPYYNLGNRVMGVYEINVPNVYSIMQANALYAYCGNSPITFFDPSGYLEEADLNILTEDDLARIRALTAEYEYYEEQGNTAVMEAIRRCAVEIRSQDIYDDKYNIGKYEDTYEYTTTETSDIYVNAMVMDRGYAWLIGGSNDKNDDILSLMESADVSGVTNFFDALLALVLISKYDRVKKVLSEGDVEIRIENREGDSDEKFTKTAYYLRDGTFVVSETNYYLSGNGVFHEINPDIEVPGWIESVL